MGAWGEMLTQGKQVRWGCEAEGSSQTVQGSAGGQWRDWGETGRE